MSPIAKLVIWWNGMRAPRWRIEVHIEAPEGLKAEGVAKIAKRIELAAKRAARYG